MLLELDNESTLKELKRLNKEIDEKHKNESKYNEWCYSNLRITKLENEFFILFSARHKKSKTYIFRKYIRALMLRNPGLVVMAKKNIDNNIGSDINE